LGFRLQSRDKPEAIRPEIHDVVDNMVVVVSMRQQHATPERDTVVEMCKSKLVLFVECLVLHHTKRACQMTHNAGHVK
jgi:hypothetical protein